MAAALRAQLKAHIEDMINTGLLDEQFKQVQKLYQNEDGGFVAEMVGLFCNETDLVIDQLTLMLQRPVVDYESLSITVHQLKGSCACVGAEKVHNASTQLREFCLQKDRNGCLNALETVKSAFYQVRSKFQIMIQLENQIQVHSF